MVKQLDDEFYLGIIVVNITEIICDIIIAIAFIT